jgi:TPR repeat protein
VASRAGNTDAMRAVGDILLESAKTTEQTIRAAAWLGAAANRGNLQAMLDLTKLYLNMDGLLYDSLRAFFWSGVACRVSHTAQEKQFCIQEHARATAALFWTNRPILDRQIAAWHPNTPPLPE